MHLSSSSMELNGGLKDLRALWETTKDAEVHEGNQHPGTAVLQTAEQFRLPSGEYTPRRERPGDPRCFPGEEVFVPERMGSGSRRRSR